MQISSFTEITDRLRFLLNRKQKIFLVVIFALTLLLSVVETISISAIMPFATVASNPETLDAGRFKVIYNFLGFKEKTTFIIAFGISIIILYIFRSVYSTIYTYVINKFSIGTSRTFARRLFKIFFSIPYKNYVQKNSGNIIYLINGQTARAANIVMNILGVFSESFTLLLLYAFMVIVNWQMTLVLTMVLGVGSYCVMTILLKITKRQGEKATVANIKMMRTLQETFGNFKFIKLRGNEGDLLKKYDSASHTLIRSQLINSVLSVLPRNILENLGFSILIASMIFIVWKLNSPESIIPIIATYALAFYRMLPALNKIFIAINAMVYDQNALNAVYDAMIQEKEEEGSAKISFEKNIKIEDVSFEYVGSDKVLRNISLEINKGESVAVTGESGGGKSTLIDILIGVNRPTSGTIYIDGVKITSENIRSWRNKIGYIPQSIYLFDGTISDNVTFSSEFDEERLIKTLKAANIWEFLEKKDGIHTCVGEGGIQLSGGQKQRVGIARAIYSNPEVLVLDEATSALDNETEGKIMDEIYEVGKDKTLIIIAHRLTTVERCKRRIVIENGRISEDRFHRATKSG